MLVILETQNTKRSPPVRHPTRQSGTGLARGNLDCPTLASLLATFRAGTEHFILLGRKYK
jgi:hypothetical protein